MVKLSFLSHAASFLRKRRIYHSPIEFFVINVFFLGCSLIALLITLVIVGFLLYDTLRFFALIPVSDFLFGLQWSPQIALRDDQVGSSGAFGAIPVFAGTLLITAIAMTISVSSGLILALFMSEYASVKLRSSIKPIIEILAGIPTVVYGFFAAVTVAPVIGAFGRSFGMDVSSESALAAGSVMGIMIIPFISSLCDDIFHAFPQSLREASFALGSTRHEMMFKMLLPTSFPGIIGAILLAFGRAIGETMIVTMAAGLIAHLTFNPFESVTTVTAQIVTLLIGDHTFDSAKTLAAFGLGFTLFCVTFILNVSGRLLIQKYQTFHS